MFILISKQKMSIYCFSNPSMPGIYKIGFTERNVDKRITELYTTGVPEPFHLEFSVLVDNPKKKERILHQLLEQSKNITRIKSNREFFRGKLEDIKLYFMLMGMNMNEDELLYEKPIPQCSNNQTINAVKHQEKMKDVKRVSTDMKRPKNITSCFKRDTLIHHNKGGNNEYAVISLTDGKIHRCDSEMKNIGESYDSINAFTNENYRRKNEREGTNRTLRNNAYVECLYKNDYGVWSSCDDLKDEIILTNMIST